VRILALIAAVVISAAVVYVGHVASGPVAELAICGAGQYLNSSKQCVPNPSAGQPAGGMAMAPYCDLPRGRVLAQRGR
jgi:hypothetical protein